MFFNSLRYALRQPASLFELYKAINATKPKQMNTWLLFSSMGLAIIFARGGERLVCVDIEKAGRLAASQ
jgi:hypothetical protein